MNEFAKRRAALLKRLPPNSLVILPAQPVAMRNGDVEYPYRPDSSFYYLTGFPEPSAVAVFSNLHKKPHYSLFCQPKDKKQEQWHGYRIGTEEACKTFGADEAFSIDTLDKIIPEHFRGIETIVFPLEKMHWQKKITQWLFSYQKRHRRQQLPNPALINVEPFVAELRLFKSPEEISHMREAAKLSAAAHTHIMRVCKPGLTEYQLEAEFLYHLQRTGCRHTAYPSIVASGKNGTTLHYVENNAMIEDGDLVLIDAGAEYQYYASDITRTFPANGKFTAEQRALYELVLHTQTTAINLIRPDIRWQTIYDHVIRELTQGMVDLGLLQGSVNELIEQKKYTEFYMHNFGHWLGMDVHDVGAYQKNNESRAFESNMVLTVEPGIYIDQHNQNVDEKWRGLAVRIEDDILVTQTGTEILSGDLVKKVADIELLMKDHANM